MPGSHKHKRVAISLLCATYYGREAIRGILDYSTSYTDWEIHHQGGGGDEAASSTEMAIRRWGVQGVIAQLTNTRLAKVIRHSGIPAVDVWSEMDSGLPTIRPDDAAASRCVAEYFMSRGFHNYAWCSYGGDSIQNFSTRRRDAFVEALGQRGHQCHVFPCRSRPALQSEVTQMPHVQRWLKELPKPVALMAPHDYRARELVLACSWIGLRVPEQVAVIGVDNDSVECRLCQPHLSSVNTQAYEIGYRAAALLDKLMKGGKRPARPIEIAPAGIVSRKSSDTYAVLDVDTAAALRFISEHAGEPITVADVLANVPMSRRSLERRFTELLKRTPREQILRVHVEQAKRLLENTGLKLATVATRSGFTPNQMFSRLFQQVEGVQPSEYRRKFQGRVSNLEEH